MPDLVFAAHEARAHHRRQGQRDEHGDEDRHRHGDAELAEQPADDPAHQEQRYEHGDEREADRHDRKADLTGALDRRLHRAQPILEMAVDVLEHDDRVVDDKANRDRQRHQRQIVEAVAQHVHDRESADKRQRHGDARDYCRPQAAQENEDNRHDESDGEQQCKLNVGDGSADRLRAVAQHLDLDRRRDGRLQLRQSGLDAVHGLDDVGAGQFENRQQNGLLAVGEGREAGIFRAVYCAPDIAHPHRSTVLVGDDDVVPGRSIEHLAVVVDCESPGLPVDGSFRAHGRRVDYYPAQILQREAK